MEMIHEESSAKVTTTNSSPMISPMVDCAR